MRATINIPDDDLIAEVKEISEEKTKTKAIVTAMQEFSIRQKKKKRASCAERGKFRLDYDWGKEEEREIKHSGERAFGLKNNILADTCVWIEFSDPNHLQGGASCLFGSRKILVWTSGIVLIWTYCKAFAQNERKNLFSESWGASIHRDDTALMEQVSRLLAGSMKQRAWHCHTRIFLLPQ